MDLYEIGIKDKLPFISLSRDLTDFDLGPVTEKENSVRFILDDDPWEFENDKHQISLRFKHAVDLEKTLREMASKHQIKLSEVHFLHLANICKVFRIVTSNESMKPAIEKTIYEKSIQEINNSIDEFNFTSFTKGVAK